MATIFLIINYDCFVEVLFEILRVYLMCSSTIIIRLSGERISLPVVFTSVYCRVLIFVTFIHSFITFI